MIFSFWFSLLIIIYTFLGYGILLFCLVQFKSLFKKRNPDQTIKNISLPTCSLLIAAYNEEYFIRNKILNTLSLNYPANLLQIYIVTDGSTDNTNQIVSEFKQVNLLYQPVRKGKIAAVHRAMQYINTEIVVFTDANTFLNKDAIVKICNHYSDPKIGCVAGEKRIYTESKADASSAGEGFYWKYESKLKEWDSKLNSTIGAAGELFSIRRKLYEPVSENIILDDFIISMKIACKGYRIIYERDAYAIESSSSDINEELKRKIRIAAGGIQAIFALRKILNPFEHKLLSFQYFSHRVLRWSLTPFLLVFVFVLNLLLTVHTNHLIYYLTLTLQAFFYLLAIIGFILEKKQLKLKAAFIPYYFCIMNYAIIIGIFKYWTIGQSAIWDKAKRKENVNDLKPTANLNTLNN